jgi:hypothetical protein
MAIVLRPNSKSDLDLASIVGEESPLFNKKIASIKSLIPKGEITVLIHANLSNISNDVYGSPNYSWIIGLYNGVTDSDITPGMKLLYPSLESVELVV